MLSKPGLAVAALLLGAFFSPHSNASTILPSGAVGLNYVAGGVQYVDAGNLASSPGTVFQGRTFSVPSARTLSLAETYGLQLGGNSLTVQAGRALTVAELGLGLASGAIAVAAAGQAGWAVGSAIARALGLGDTDGGARIAPTANGWMQDPGAAPTGGGSPQTTYQFCSAYSDIGCGSPATTREAACASFNGHFPQGSIASADMHMNGNSCEGGYFGASGQSYGGENLQTRIASQPGPSTTCAGYVDALNSAYSNANPTPGADGKCPTGRYTQPVAAPAAAQTIAEKMPDAVMPDAAKWLLDNGQPIKAADERHISGPQSISGQPTTRTVTNSNGSSSTSTSTPTTNYTYNNNSVTYNVSNVTTTQTKAADGTTNTVTTTTNTPNTTVPTAPAAAAETPKNQCETNPDSIGCSKFGDLPTDSPTWTTKPVTWSVDDLGLPSGCPADTIFVLRGWELPLHYKPACDVAPTIRLALTIMAAVGCAMFIVRGVAA